MEVLIPDEGLSIYWGLKYGGLGLGTPGSWNPLTSEPQRDIGFMFPEENRLAHILPVPQEAVGFESSAGGGAVCGVSDSWIPRGLWTLVPNSWIVGGLHLEEGTGAV